MDKNCYREDRKIRNLLNGLDRDTRVFRIFSCKWFLQLLQKHELALVKPMLWDDPFENFLLSAPVMNPDGTQICLESLKQSYYGQCWTLNYESDAMWRIYSQDKMGIKVSTTVGKLFDAFYDHRDDSELRCYFGLVTYHSEQELKNIFLNKDTVCRVLFDGSGLELAKSLLLKRQEFNHEREARLIYADQRQSMTNSYSFKIDPNSLFDEITLDPRISDTDQEIISTAIIRHGCSVGVTKSSLYAIPDLKIVIPVLLLN